MNKVIGLLIASFCLTSAGIAMADYQFAPKKSSGPAPLMVIRFEQPEVVYQKALYDTMSKALQIKPSAKFDIISVAVQSNDKRTQRYNNDVAAMDLGNVLATFNEMEVPADRYTTSNLTEAVKYPEVRIYVH